MNSVSVIIITFDGYREGNVPLLLNDVKQQKDADIELIMVKGVSPVGKARNIGIKRATKDYIIFLDDDIRLPNNRVIKEMVEGIKRHPDDLVGGARLIPPDSSVLQRRAARELPKQMVPPPDKDLVSDDIATYCWGSRATLYSEIGLFDENITAGEDTKFRKQVRRAGKRTILLADVYIYHPIRKNIREMIKQYFWYGKGSGNRVKAGFAAPFLFKLLSPFHVIIRISLFPLQVILPDFHKLDKTSLENIAFNPLQTYLLTFYYIGFACG